MRGPTRRWRRVGPTAALLAALLGPGPLAAEDPVLLVISSPPPGVPSFGTVTFAAAPSPAAPGVVVEYFLDGRSIGVRRAPPWEVVVDVGEENRPRRYLARATLPSGETSEALLVTPAIEVNEEISAELQQLYVTVTRFDGSRLLDLGQEDFVILDEGDKQDMITFARGDVRLAATLLIDASASMQGTPLRNALDGARTFVERMREIDDASITLFSDRLIHRTPFSNDVAVLTAGFEDVVARGGTALNDHLYFALKQLEREQGRRVVILLSDGVDSHSALRTPELRWLSRRSRALVYWIRIGSASEIRKSRFSAWKNPDQYRSELDDLEEIVTTSGGRIVPLEDLDQADEAFRDILAELREQYVLGYYPSNAANDGSWHRTTVRVRGGYRVRSQAGYVDY